MRGLLFEGLDNCLRLWLHACCMGAVRFIFGSIGMKFGFALVVALGALLSFGSFAARGEDKPTTKPAMACCGDECKKMGDACCKLDDKGKATCDMGGKCCVKEKAMEKGMEMGK